MTNADFERVLKSTRFKDNMTAALQLVFVRKMTQTEAAKKIGVTRQAVSAAAISFRKACLHEAVVV